MHVNSTSQKRQPCFRGSTGEEISILQFVYLPNSHVSSDGSQRSSGSYVIFLVCALRPVFVKVPEGRIGFLSGRDDCTFLRPVCYASIVKPRNISYNLANFLAYFDGIIS